MVTPSPLVLAGDDLARRLKSQDGIPYVVKRTAACRLYGVDPRALQEHITERSAKARRHRALQKHLAL